VDHSEMVDLIRGGLSGGGGVWADLGAGTGNFTWALAELLGPGATIYAVDRDGRAMQALRARMAASPPAATIIPQQAEVGGPLRLPPLDGILMANLLHFIRDQPALLRRLAGLLRPDGRLLVVEYEQSTPLPWVPFPTPFARLGELCGAVGLGSPRQIGARRSPSSGQVLYAAAAAPSMS
jgi:ubiquinone/menaquinone biosynthesis C-methylase UbiE